MKFPATRLRIARAVLQVAQHGFAFIDDFGNGRGSLGLERWRRQEQQRGNQLPHLLSVYSAPQ
jgi:hypothetical protein